MLKAKVDLFNKTYEELLLIHDSNIFFWGNVNTKLSNCLEEINDVLEEEQTLIKDITVDDGGDIVEKFYPYQSSKKRMRFL